MVAKPIDFQQRPTVITSNKSLTEWAAIVQDASLAAALVDRILHHGEVFYLKGPSWRVKGRGVDGELNVTPTASTARRREVEVPPSMDGAGLTGLVSRAD